MKVIDMHCDSITRLIHNQQDLYQNDNHISIVKLQKGNYALQCFAMFIYLAKTNHPYQTCDEYIDKYYQMLDENKNFITPVYNYAQLANNFKENRLSSLLTIEEGEAIEGSLNKLEHFYQRGVRMMTLTWNFENHIGFPNKVKEQQIDNENGLKDFGYEVVDKMNELGMIIDVSHGSDKLFWDVINHSKKTIICSHSNARSIHNVTRNLTDEMIIALANQGGITGINYNPPFVSANEKENQIPMLVEHIKHIVKVGGIDCCALGSDFDGIDTPVGMADATKTPLLQEALKEAGFTNSEIEKIFYRNFLRVFKDICG